MIGSPPEPACVRRSVRDGLLIGNLDTLDEVGLCGSRCAACGETSLGANAVCPNCGGDAVQAIRLSDHGRLWSFTIIRHKPPGAYHGPDPFAPFAVGLVELPDGLRVMARVEGAIDSLAIGMALRLIPFILRTDAQGRQVVAFSYQAAP